MINMHLAQREWVGGGWEVYPDSIEGDCGFLTMVTIGWGSMASVWTLVGEPF